MLKNVLNHALDWVLPPLCPATGEAVDEHGTVAPAYWSSLNFVRPPYCARCSMPFAYQQSDEGQDESLICGACIDHPPRYGRGRAALAYDDASRQLILRFKHGDQHQAVRAMVPWMITAGQALLNDCDVLMPVPLHRWRLLRRRYNQSSLLADALGKATGKPVCHDVLLRTRATVPQGHMPPKERAANVRNAFGMNLKKENIIKDKTVLLIDDVMTTGSTLNECADTLMSAGAKEVDVLTVAKVVRNL